MDDVTHDMAGICSSWCSCAGRLGTIGDSLHPETEVCEPPVSQATSSDLSDTRSIGSVLTAAVILRPSGQGVMWPEKICSITSSAFTVDIGSTFLTPSAMFTSEHRTSIGDAVLIVVVVCDDNIDLFVSSGASVDSGIDVITNGSGSTAKSGDVRDGGGGDGGSTAAVAVTNSCSVPRPAVDAGGSIVGALPPLQSMAVAAVVDVCVASSGDRSLQSKKAVSCSTVTSCGVSGVTGVIGGQSRSLSADVVARSSCADAAAVAAIVASGMP